MPRPITPDVIYDLTNVSDPAISADSGKLVFVRSKVEPDLNQICTRLMIMTLPDGMPTEFTSGGQDSSPKFSPNGETIAFLRPDEKNKKQVWLIPVSGGEASQFTDAQGGVSEFAWAPNSCSIVYGSDVDPDLPPDDHDPKITPLPRVVGRIRYRYDTIGWRGNSHRHLFLAHLYSGNTRMLTDGDWDDGMAVWSPDGTRVAFVSGRKKDRDIRATNEAYVLDLSGNKLECWSEGLDNVVSLTWSPSGHKILALGSADPKNMGHWQGRLYLLEKGEEPKKLTDDTVSPVAGFPGSGSTTEIRWLEDGRILFLADRRGESFVFELDLKSRECRVRMGGGARLSGLTLDEKGTTGAVVAITPYTPGDINLVDIATKKQRQLTHYNDEYMNKHPAGALEKFSLSRGDLQFESRIFFPPGFDLSLEYPMILDVHGGPHGVFYDSFNPAQQVMATAGYVVLAVNPRGSSSYGEDFMKAVLQDWGGEDYLDIMAAVDDMVSRSYIDKSRLGVMGYSYGGFMTSWIIGHDTRFKAAVIGAPCINLSSMYGTSDIGVSFGEVHWGGMRKDAVDLFRIRSPLTYAPEVQTPVLLMHGEDDHRCPISQSEEYFVTLKRLGKEVEFVRFPESAHSFLTTGRPSLRRDYLTRMLQWFDERILPVR